MTAFSMADFRARQVPPWGCQRCERVQVTQAREGAGVVTRWTCGEGLHLQDVCTARVPTKFNKPKEPQPCAGV